MGGQAILPQFVKATQNLYSSHMVKHHASTSLYGCYVMPWIVFLPKFTCWSPYIQYLRMGWHLEIGSLKSQVKNGIPRVGPMQYDWCPFKRKSGQRWEIRWGHRKKMASYKPKREATERNNLTHGLSLQGCATEHFCHLSHAVYNTLFLQPWQINMSHFP